MKTEAPKAVMLAIAICQASWFRRIVREPPIRTRPQVLSQRLFPCHLSCRMSRVTRSTGMRKNAVTGSILGPKARIRKLAVTIEARNSMIAISSVLRSGILSVVLQ